MIFDKSKYLDRIYKAIGVLPPGFYIGKINYSEQDRIIVQLVFFECKEVMEFDIQTMDHIKDDKVLKGFIKSMLMNLTFRWWNENNRDS